MKYLSRFRWLLMKGQRMLKKEGCERRQMSLGSSKLRSDKRDETKEVK
jgi:hypothetical protein